MQRKEEIVLAAVVVHPIAVALFLLPVAYWVLPAVMALVGWLAAPVVILLLLGLPISCLRHLAIHTAPIWLLSRSDMAPRSRGWATAAGILAELIPVAALALLLPALAGLSLIHVVSGHPPLAVVAFLTAALLYGNLLLGLLKVVRKARTAPAPLRERPS